MNVDDSVTIWIDRLRQGDQQSAQQLWKGYYAQLVRIAGAKLPKHVRRPFDEEDVALIRSVSASKRAGFRDWTIETIPGRCWSSLRRARPRVACAPR